ncbi:MAG: hypothetical protein Q8L77_04025 [Nitrospirota bacterium]|nr:hypothetical protein [Nitrospirota bacterium]
MTIRREIAAWLAGWNTKGIVEWARLHVSQSRAHPRSCYLATLEGATAAPLALGAVGTAAAG